MLCRHRFFNGRYFRRHCPEIECHRSLTVTQQRMIGCRISDDGDTGISPVVEEKDALGD